MIWKFDMLKAVEVAMLLAKPTLQLQKEIKDLLRQNSIPEGEEVDK